MTDVLLREAQGTRTEIGTVVSQELRELTGAAVVAVYVTASGGAHWLAGLAGPARAVSLARAPGLALRACSTLRCAHADDAELRELERLGLSCGDALAAPLVSDGEALGSLLLVMPADDDLVADEELVADVAVLTASAFAAERRLALDDTRSSKSWRGRSRVCTIRSPGGSRAGTRESAEPPPSAGSRSARVLADELLRRSDLQIVAALTGALEAKDSETAAHSHRVQLYALALARALEPSLLRDPSVEFGFVLHDVGKLGIPDHVLRKPGPLTDSEQRVMRTHTVLGEQLLRDVTLLHGEGLKVVRSHHERWDGLGYPDGLRRDEIPLAARVFAVADALDAITSERPYRAARSWAGAVAEILDGGGRQFDPDVVDAFLERERPLCDLHLELAAAS